MTSKTHFDAPSIKKVNVDFSCTASAVSHYFFLFKSPQLCLLYGTHLCHAGTLLFSTTHPVGPGIKSPCPAPCQEGSEVGVAKTGAELSVRSGWWNDFAWKSPEKQHPAWLLSLENMELPAQRHSRVCSQRHIEGRCESCLNSWGLLSVHGWLLGILGVCSWMHLEL